MHTSVDAQAGTPMSPAQRSAFERDGFLLIPGALSRTEVDTAREAVARVYQAARNAGELDAAGALHRLSAVRSCPDLAFLLDHPATFGLVWSVLGWNVHVYHSHLDVHPRRPEGLPHRWEWHQDGGRQNREIETDPRPRLSVKVAYWLSDVSQRGRGNLTIIPGSHVQNWLPGPPRRDVAWPEPEGAVQVQVNAGDALLFDRRIWHRRSDNRSDRTRMAVFFGYTLRWIAIRDEITATDRESQWWASLNPVQRQLLGGSGDETGDHLWGHFPQDTAVYCRLRDAGVLDPTYPPLIPDAPDAPSASDAS
jgi:hypothetical protein